MKTIYGTHCKHRTCPMFQNLIFFDNNFIKIFSNSFHHLTHLIELLNTLFRHLYNLVSYLESMLALKMSNFETKMAAQQQVIYKHLPPTAKTRI